MSYISSDRAIEAMQVMWSSFGESFENVQKTLKDRHLDFSDEEYNEFVDFTKQSDLPEEKKRLLYTAAAIATIANKDEMHYEATMEEMMYGKSGNRFESWFQQMGIEFIPIEESMNMPTMNENDAAAVANELRKKGIAFETIKRGEDEAYFVVKRSDYAETLAAIVKEDMRVITDDEMAVINKKLSAEYIEKVVGLIQPQNDSQEAIEFANAEKEAVSEYFKRELQYLKAYAWTSKGMTFTGNANDRMFDMLVENAVKEIVDYEQLQKGLNRLYEVYATLSDDIDDYPDELRKEAKRTLKETESVLKAVEKFNFDRTRSLSKIGSLMDTVTVVAKHLEELSECVEEKELAELNKEELEELRESEPELFEELNNEADKTAKESIENIETGLSAVQEEIAELQKEWHFVSVDMWTYVADFGEAVINFPQKANNYIVGQIKGLGEWVQNGIQNAGDMVRAFARDQAQKAEINIIALGREICDIGRVTSKMFKEAINLETGLAVELRHLTRAYRLTAERYINQKTLGAHSKKAQRILEGTTFKEALQVENDLNAEKAQKEAGVEVESHGETLKDLLSYGLMKIYAKEHGLKNISDIQAYLAHDISTLAYQANKPKSYEANIEENKANLIDRVKGFITQAKTGIVEMKISATTPNGKPLALEELQADAVRLKARERLALMSANRNSNIAQKESRRALEIIKNNNETELAKTDESMAVIEAALIAKNYSAKENAALNIAMGIDESKAEAEHWHRYTEEKLEHQHGELIAKGERLEELIAKSDLSDEKKTLYASELEALAAEQDYSKPLDEMLQHLEKVEDAAKVANSLVFAYSQQKGDIETAIAKIEAEMAEKAEAAKTEKESSKDIELEETDQDMEDMYDDDNYGYDGTAFDRNTLDDEEIMTDADIIKNAVESPQTEGYAAMIQSLIDETKKDLGEPTTSAETEIENLFGYSEKDLETIWEIKDEGKIAPGIEIDKDGNLTVDRENTEKEETARERTDDADKETEKMPSVSIPKEDFGDEEPDFADQ